MGHTRGHLAGFFILAAASLAAFLVWAPPASEAVQDQPKQIFAVMDDQASPELVLQAGFDTVKRTIYMDKGVQKFTDLNSVYRNQLESYFSQAQEVGLKVIIELWPARASAVPLRPAQQRGYCDVAVDLVKQYPSAIEAVEVGVEPNNHRFWEPQFGPDGRNSSAEPYTSWLGACYDKIKQANPETLVIGGALASWGGDNPSKGRWTNTSPVLFVQKICEAYKASGRARPIMDWFDMHSYQANSSDPPSTQHPYPSTAITIGDQSKLEDLLSCFSGTAQPIPPIWWGEVAYQSQIPASQQYRYSGKEPPGGDPVDEVTQGDYIAEGIQMAYCNGSVGYGQFHVLDEPQRGGWQSGTYYAYSHRQPQRRTQAAISQLAKRSAPIVRSAVEAAESGTMKCG